MAAGRRFPIKARLSLRWQSVGKDLYTFPLRRDKVDSAASK